MDGDTALISRGGKVIGGGPFGPTWVSGGVWFIEKQSGQWDGGLNAGVSYFESGTTQIALDGDRAAVSSYDPGNGWTPPSGGIRVFHRDPGWTQEAYLVLGEGAVPHLLGISGDRLVAYSATNGPAVHVLEKGPAGWIETPKLILGSVASAGSLALDGDVLFVGSPGDDVAGTDAGAVVVYEHGPSGWVQTALLAASDTSAGDRFGSSIDLEGDVALIGAPGADGSLAVGGLAYVFQRSGDGWVETQRLEPAALEDGDDFGTSVALSGSRVLVGASGDDWSGPAPGTVYDFETGIGQSLYGCPQKVHLDAGETQDLQLDAGAVHAGEVYLLLGTLGATEPGIPLDGLVLPLAVDDYLLYVLANPNTAPLSSSLGVLDAAGQASASFTVPFGTSLLHSGTLLHHAFVCFGGTGPAVFASNPVPVTLIP